MIKEPRSGFSFRPLRTRYPVDTYASFICPACGRIVGIKDLKRKAWLMRDQECKYGHGIDWSGEPLEFSEEAAKKVIETVKEEQLKMEI